MNLVSVSEQDKNPLAAGYALAEIRKDFCRSSCKSILCNNPQESRERKRAGLKPLAAGYALAEIRKDFVGVVVKSNPLQ